MDDRPYPDVRRGLIAGAIAGSVGSILAFLWTYIIAQSPPMTDVSLCWAFRPWPWRSVNWEFAGGAFLFFFLTAGVLTALRPRTEAGQRCTFLTGRRRSGPSS